MNANNTKEIIHNCKQKVLDCYEKHKTLTGPLNCAKFRVQLDKILTTYLIHYAQKDSEMCSLIQWVVHYQDKKLDENMSMPSQNDTLNQVH